MEIILVVALVLIFTIPFLTGLLGDFSNRVDIERRVQKATEVAQGIETVSNLGPGNYITVATSYGLKIEQNSLIIMGATPEDDIIVQLTPKVNDDKTEEGEIKIINDENEGVVIENYPELYKWKSASAGQGTDILLIGKHFTEKTFVVYNNRELEQDDINYINTTSIIFTPPAILSGAYPTFVRKYVGNDFLESETIFVPTGVAGSGGSGGAGGPQGPGGSGPSLG